MRLNNIIKNVRTTQSFGNQEVEIVRIDFDSRQVSKGSLFFAVRGTQVDGHDYILRALANGASAVVCETLPEVLPDEIPFIQVKNAAEALGIAASNFYDNPTEKLKLVGITGTNGKTTTVTLLYDLFSKLGYKCGLISTVRNKIAGRVVEATHTTPDPVQLNALLAEMVEEGCDYAFMEVSSHAVEQRRIAGLHFVGGAFTNITHDHLDYHKTFANYLAAKKKFFDDMPKTSFVVTNLDDKNGMVMTQNTKAKIFTYSLKKMADYKAKILDNGITGLHLDIDNQDFICRLIGEFNAYNLLMVYAIALNLGAKKDEVLEVLSGLTAAEGRFDYVRNDEKDITAIIDYAHTPDALEKVLQTINDMLKGKGNIITVVGCGGDRDKTKRPEMAAIACSYSQKVILTSDNPRNEKPDDIIQDMVNGVTPDNIRKVLVITDREQAIKTACALAQEHDFILVAGKGHEKYQEFENKRRIFFDDKKIVGATLAVAQ
jgi:UDP-N-acetylmuramoyl-L-alanyl-D-glutamate--2,6-diaminopimelate ligase